MVVLAHFKKEVESGFGAFEKMKHIFSIAPVENLEKSNTHRTLGVEASDAGPSMRCIVRLWHGCRVSIERSALDASWTLFEHPVPLRVCSTL